MPRAKATPPPVPPMHAIDATRMRLEDAINEYAKAYASWCAHSADVALVDRCDQRVHDAISAYTAAVRSEAHVSTQ